MKILCGPDLHIRVTTPEYRVDDFVAAQKHKIDWIVRLALKWDCYPVFFPGDITDNPKLPYHITQYYTRKFRMAPFTVIGTWGQHDLLYHVGKENTPLYTMDAGGAILLPRTQPWSASETPTSPIVWVYTVGWGDEIPEITTEGTNILVIHKMFIHDKLWEGQEEYTRSLIFLKKNKWDLIVSGDNHQSFMSFAKGDKYHVNCGSLMRQNIDQIHHKPLVYIYDTEKKTLQEHYIPIDPYKQVFDLDRAQEKKERDSKMDTFIENIKRKHGVIEGMDFDENISGRLEQDDIDDATRDMTKEMIKNAYNRLQ